MPTELEKQRAKRILEEEAEAVVRRLQEEERLKADLEAKAKKRREEYLARRRRDRGVPTPEGMTDTDTPFETKDLKSDVSSSD